MFWRNLLHVFSFIKLLLDFPSLFYSYLIWWYEQYYLLGPPKTNSGGLPPQLGWVVPHRQVGGG